MITVNSLCKVFEHITAVDKVSFQVKPGEILGFLGPNGAGKTTTMKMITGFLTPTSGHVTVFDQDVVQQPLAVKQMIGYVPEGAPLYGDMTVRQYLNFIAEVRGFKKKARDRAVEKVIVDLKLEHVVHQKIETLSKGFKRRVALAQAMVHDPKILILDEPTDGLDPNQKRHVRDLIRNLSADKIVIISTHILEEVESVCTRAVILADGKIVADDVPEKLCQQSGFHGAVVVELSETLDLQSTLTSLPEVDKAVQDPDFNQHYRVIPKQGTNLLQALLTAAEQHRWPVSGIYYERGRLEDVFCSLTIDSPEQEIEHHG